jgi:FMN phosphatase YigB (HAD superfamily)
LGILKDKSQEFEDIYEQSQDEINTTREIDSLLPIYKEKFGIKLPENYSFLIDGFAKRFEKNLDIWSVIDFAKSKYKIGLLTNMYPNMLTEIKKAELLSNIEFDQAIDSSIEKVQKPYKEIYELAEKRCGFKGNEILFIDNSQKHLDGAKQLGWQTFLYDPTDTKKTSNELLKMLG